MMNTISVLKICLASVLFCLVAPGRSQNIHHASLIIHHLSLPSDVRSNHWAASYVQEALDNSVMALPDGKEFHGEAKVTHGQAVIALAKLARMLEAGTWKAQPSRPVPDSVLKPLEQGDWRTQSVTRYELAKVLASMGDYVMKGLQRSAPDAKSLGQSEAFPPKPKIALPKTHPAYAALTYLADNNMVLPKSPLLTADARPLLGGELSQAVADMVAGVTNRVTEVGKDADGSTPDASFHKKPQKSE